MAIQAIVRQPRVGRASRIVSEVVGFTTEIAALKKDLGAVGLVSVVLMLRLALFMLLVCYSLIVYRSTL